MFTIRKATQPFVGPFDPCPPIRVKVYETPQQLYVDVQPPGLEQFDPFTALQKGTLWPALYNPYYGRDVEKGVETIRER